MGISANQARLLTLTARQHDLELRAQQISAQKMILSLQSQQWASKYSTALNEYTAGKQVQYVAHTEEKSLTLSKSYLTTNGAVLYNGETELSVDSDEAFANAILNNGYGIYRKTLKSGEIVPSSEEQVTAKLKELLGGNWTFNATAQNDNGKYYLMIDAATVYDGNGSKVGLCGATQGTFSSMQAAFEDSNYKSYVHSTGYVTQAELEAAGVTFETKDAEYEYTPIYAAGSITSLTQTWEETTYEEVVSESSVNLDVVKGEYDAAMAALSSQEKLMDMELTQINTEHQAVKTEYDSIKSLISDNVEKSFNIFG